MKSNDTFMRSMCIMGLSMFSFIFTQAQVLDAPRASQESKSYQKIGLTDLAVWYHSPQVNDREVWDVLVPYGQVWRAGANENTIFYCSTEITVEGEKLPAGKYGLHMIPTADSWTIIFSSNRSSWGSYFYKEDEDVLRVKVKPNAHEHTEWLNYTFTDRSANHATLELQWAELSIPISIDVDVVETTYASMENEIRGQYGFTWQGHNQMANFCMQKGVHLEEGYGHAQQAVQWGRNFNTLMGLSRYEVQMGNADKAKKLEKEALDMANEQQMNLYGYQLMGAGDLDAAQSIFMKNAELHPESWNCWDSLAESYLNQKDKKNALKYYQKALKMAPEDQKARIEGIISNI